MSLLEVTSNFLQVHWSDPSSKLMAPLVSKIHELASRIPYCIRSISPTLLTQSTLHKFQIFKLFLPLKCILGYHFTRAPPYQTATRLVVSKAVYTLRSPLHLCVSLPPPISYVSLNLGPVLHPGFVNILLPK